MAIERRSTKDIIMKPLPTFPQTFHFSPLQAPLGRLNISCLISSAAGYGELRGGTASRVLARPLLRY